MYLDPRSKARQIPSDGGVVHRQATGRLRIHAEGWNAGEDLPANLENRLHRGRQAGSAVP